MRADGSCCDPKVRHGGRRRPTMFTKQVSRPVDAWIPIMAIEAEQVERTQRKTWSWARSRFFVPYGRRSVPAQGPSLDPETDTEPEGLTGKGRRSALPIS